MKKLFIILSFIVSVSGFSQALDSTMNFCLGKEQFIAAGEDRSRPRIFDFDKDGDKDFAVLEFWYDSLAIYLNDGTADFTLTPPIKISVAGNLVDLAIGDFDADSYIDIATISDVGDLSFFKNNSGSGLISMGTMTNTTLPNLYANKIEVYDLNNDGLLDIIGTGYDQITTGFYAFTFQQSVTFSFFSINPFPILAGHNAQFNLPEALFSVADFDGDGFKDFVVGSSDMVDTLMVYKNSGISSAIAYLLTASTFTNPVGGYPKYIIAGDYNGDAQPDIAVSSFGGISINKNAGGLVFTPMFTDPFFSGDQFDIADLNSDTKKELISANYGSYNIYPGTGLSSVNFKPYSNYFSMFDMRTFGLADFDGNSTLDILFLRGGDFPYVYISRNFSFYVQEYITSTNTVVCGSTPVTFSCSNTHSTYPGSYDWTPGPASGINYTAPTAGGTVSCAFSYTLPPGLGHCVLYTDTIIVNVQSPATAVFSATVSAINCAGTSVPLSVSVVPASSTYTWSTGSTASSIVVSPTTTTTYSVFMDNGCQSTATYTLNVNPKPVVNITSTTTTICSGDSLVLTGSGAGSYTWYPALATSTTLVVKPTTTSVYSLVGVNSFGCKDTANTTITVNSAPIVGVLPSKTLICFPDTVTLSASGASTYSWSTGANTASVSVLVFSNTNYTVTGSNGCNTAFVFSVTGVPRPTINAVASKSTVCSGDSVTLQAFGAASYTWAPTFQIGSSIFNYPTVPTTYSVLGINSNGCYNHTSVSVGLNPLPSLEILVSELCVGKSATFTAIGASTYTWSNGYTSPSFAQTPANTSQLSFTVDGVDANGCKSSTNQDFLISDRCSLVVYNGVTPNGDGHNDYFRIENIEQYSGNLVLIFNRWGQKLAEINDYNNTNNFWAGTDQQVPSGTYYYVIDLKNGSELLKGYIELTKQGL